MGLTKTGTTSIQSCFYGSRRTLLRNGTLYPGFARNHSTAVATAFLESPHALLMNVVAGKDNPQAGRAASAHWMRKFQQALATPGWQRLLLSGEGLCDLPPPRMAALRDRLGECCETVTAVICLRHPLRWRISQTQQMLKLGSTIEAEIRRLSRPGHYQRMVEKIEAVFERGNVRILIFEELQAHPQGLVAGFIDTLGLRPGFPATLRAPDRNASMSLTASLVLDRLNREVPMFVGGRMNPHRSLHVERVLRRIPGPKFQLDAGQVACFRQAVEADRDWARARFGREVWQDLPASAPATVTPPRHLGPLLAMGRLAGRLVP